MHDFQFEPGTVISFSYPRHNFHGVLSKLERRRIQVEAVRDLKREPLDLTTLDIQPLLKRGRFLVVGTDLEKNAERSFYADSMRNVTPALPHADFHHENRKK